METKDENSMKNESSTNLYNLEETKDKCKVSENNLIDQYDEETVLLQIPQEDTEVGDVTKKFKNQNKAADTIVVLQEKKRIITEVMDGQSYIRRYQPPHRRKILMMYQDLGSVPLIDFRSDVCSLLHKSLKAW